MRTRWRAALAGTLGLVLAVPAVAVPGEPAHAYGLVTLAARHSGKCADVVSRSTADGAEVAQFPCNGGTNQLWGLRDLGNGYVQLVAHHSGRCLDVAGGSTVDGARVLQWACHSGTNQQWQLQDAGSGFVRLVARHSGRCVDVTGATTADGVRLQQMSCSGATNQQWRRDGVGSPVLPGLYADPNIVLFGDTYYLYPTTDGFPGWSGTQFHAFSSKDLVNWTDHGVILDLGPDVSWADNSAWAPTVAQRDGRYYFYFSGGRATGDTRKHLGVAVSDSPTGPFHDPLGRPLVPAGTYSGQMIDPAAFTDDDGQSYLYWGQGNSYQVPLNGDMVSFNPAQVRTYHPTNYNEGTFVVKRNGRYYFMWSENDTRSEDYRVAYATGSSPLGPWSNRIGVVLQKDLTRGILGTGHHSVVRVAGTDDWYIAYHRFAIPGGDGTHRETTIDLMFFNPDGTIRPVVPTLESIDPITPP